MIYGMVDKYALITGGSSGIGLDIAKELAKRNYKLLLVSNQEERLKELERDLTTEFGVETRSLFIDLSRLEAAQELYDYCLQANIEVEVLVNNAGFFFFNQIVDSDLKKAETMMRLHVITPSLLTTLFGAEMKKKKCGFILFTSSISAFKHFPGIGYYGSTKSYLKSFSRSLHTEMRPHGVHVTSVLPGATATDLYDPNMINVELGKKLGIMMGSNKVARQAVNALFRNQAEIVPGFSTKLMLFFARLTPYWLIGIIAKYSGLFK